MVWPGVPDELRVSAGRSADVSQKALHASCIRAGKKILTERKRFGGRGREKERERGERGF